MSFDSSHEARTPEYIYDITHLVSRMVVPSVTGIDRVDLAYARHFIGNKRISCGLHYGYPKPKSYSLETVQELLSRVERHKIGSTTLDADSAFARVENWLKFGKIFPLPKIRSEGFYGSDKRGPTRWTQFRFRLSNEPWSFPRFGGIYINVAQHALEYPRLLEWLDHRPDLTKVFMLHDLLPLDFPEYFTSDEAERFSKRIQTIVRHADGLVVTTHDVAKKATDYYETIGKKCVPIHVAPLASPLLAFSECAPALRDIPYFVIVGTIEPRKNHLLLLNIWRELAQNDYKVPKLVVIGTRGWENEQVVDMLERCSSIRPYVLEVSGLSNAGLLALISGARALLMPSFAEGYGIPVVEALSLGVPVVTSDIAVFHEVTQEKGIFLNPLNGSAWLEVILSLIDRNGLAASNAQSRAASFQPPLDQDYFQSVEFFCASIRSKRV